MEIPETRYAKTVDDVHVAYQVGGEGRVDLVWPGQTYSHIEYQWQIPPVARFLQQLGSIARLIMFDQRGTGLSDRVPEQHLPTLETRMADAVAVMDAAGSARAALLGHDSTGPLAILFAATYPERTTALILYSTYASGRWSPDYPWGWTEERWDSFLKEMEARWGEQTYFDEFLAWLAPSAVADPEIRKKLATWLRFAASPGTAVAMQQMERETDVRDVLSAVHVPTLVLHRTDSKVYSPEEARHLAEHIPGAQLVELDGVDHLPWQGDAGEIVREIERFLGSVIEEEAEFDRVLATVLFTDIVGSTNLASELRDRGWRELLERHHLVTRGLLGRYRGTEVDTAGDGFFATFDGPARAVRCAQAIVEAVRPLGLEVRAGVHTGEVETIDDKVGGIAVAIGARVAGKATPSEVLVSQTVKDLVAGSGLTFEDAGEHELKGVPDRWRLYRVVSG